MVTLPPISPQDARWFTTRRKLVLTPKDGSHTTSWFSHHKLGLTPQDGSHPTRCVHFSSASVQFSSVQLPVLSFSQHQFLYQEKIPGPVHNGARCQMPVHNGARNQMPETTGQSTRRQCTSCQSPVPGRWKIACSYQASVPDTRRQCTSGQSPVPGRCQVACSYQAIAKLPVRTSRQSPVSVPNASRKCQCQMQVPVPSHLFRPVPSRFFRPVPSRLFSPVPNRRFLPGQMPVASCKCQELLFPKVGEEGHGTFLLHIHLGPARAQSCKLSAGRPNTAFTTRMNKMSLAQF